MSSLSNLEYSNELNMWDCQTHLEIISSLSTCLYQKIVKDAKCHILFGNNIKLEDPIMYKVVKDVR